MSANSKKLALTMAGILFVLWFMQPYISKWTGSNKTVPVPMPMQMPHSSTPAGNPAVALPANNNAADPFRDHIQQNGLSNKVGSAPNLGSAASAGVDPFKAHLENQKKQAPTSGISPFGK